MSRPASKEQVVKASGEITAVVDSRESLPFHDESGSYDVTHILLIRTLRIIGGKRAECLRLAKAKSGKLAAAATYYESDKAEGLPLRHITLSKDGTAEGVFDGTLDANPYQVPAAYITELETDLAPAIPVTT